MRTQRTILLIVLSVLVVAALATTGLVLLLEVVGLLVVVAVVAAGALAHRLVVGPWHRRWGATDAEVSAALPGDELLDAAIGSTRAITVRTPAAAVWPWLVQIGFGRAGWYSYDWIDNDGLPSADRVVDEWQDLDPGDVIAMTPALGFVVREVAPGRHIVSQADDAMTWSLVLRDGGDGTCRLVSRFRGLPARGVGARLWMLLADPGAFVMERKMLLGIRDRAEAARPSATPAVR